MRNPVMVQTREAEVDAAWEERRELLLNCELESTTYGESALWDLVRGRNREGARQGLLNVARWYEHGCPPYTDRMGEVDFAAVKLCRAWHLFIRAGRLGAELLQATRAFFTQRSFHSQYQSENHAFLYHVSLYLMSGELAGEWFERHQTTGAELARAEREWLTAFVLHRLRYGWGEFNSSHYQAPVWECLCCLHDFSPDATLRDLCTDAMDVLLAEMAVESLDGMQAGAQARIYPPGALDHTYEHTRVLQYLYLGQGTAPRGSLPGFAVDLISSTYLPRSEIIRLPARRGKPFVSLSRKHLHNVADVRPVHPLEGSVRRYTYWTPDFVLGCIQHQDDYPPENPPVVEHIRGYRLEPDECNTRGYAYHQQHDWDLSFATCSTARVFSHHPGCRHAHNHWTGDWLCGCGRFFQSAGVLLALYDIPADQPCQYIHFYLPRASFDEIRCERAFVFLRAGDGYAALWSSGEREWVNEGEWAGRELLIRGSRHGVVCQTGRRQEYGSFEAFIAQANRAVIEFDPEDISLRFHSDSSEEMFIAGDGTRRMGGRDINLDYLQLDSPYLRSRWGSAHVAILDGNGAELTSFGAD